MKNVVIIGSGPAGVSASLYTVRAGFETTVVSTAGGGLYKAEKIENYYGISKPVTGRELYESGIEGAKRLGVRFIESEVVGMGFSDKFTVKTISEELSADAVIIATGSKRIKPDISNLDEFEGRGVSYCAVCDAFFYKGKNVAVLGNAQYALHEANELINIANSVTLLTNGEKPSVFDERIEVNTKKIAYLKGRDLLEKIVFEDGSEIFAGGLFVALGMAGSEDLARKMGILTKDGNISADENGATNIPGIFAAGDCTGGLLQISKAVCDGAKAGIAAINFLRKQ